MRLIDEDPTISTREIAEKVGILMAQLSSKALIEKGYVKLQNFAQSKTKQTTSSTHTAWYSG